jgi:hypothetical protein
MKQRVDKLLHWAWLSALIVSTGACGTLFHSAKEIRGQVVDEESGKPLQGVIVVAQWQPYFPPSGHRGVIHVYEAVTDREGKYHIPSWGPKPVPLGAEMRDFDPELRFFLPGYTPFVAANRIDMIVEKTPPGVSEWDGKVVKLKRHVGPIKDYAERLRVLSRTLEEPRENWKSYPRMVYALWQEEKRLPQGILGSFRKLTPIHIDWLSPGDRAYLEERGK